MFLGFLQVTGNHFGTHLLPQEYFAAALVGTQQSFAQFGRQGDYKKKNDGNYLVHLRTIATNLGRAQAINCHAQLLRLAQ